MGRCLLFLQGAISEKKILLYVDCDCDTVRPNVISINKGSKKGNKYRRPTYVVPISYWIKEKKLFPSLNSLEWINPGRYFTLL